MKSTHILLLILALVLIGLIVLFTKGGSKQNTLPPENNMQYTGSTLSGGEATGAVVGTGMSGDLLTGTVASGSDATGIDDTVLPLDQHANDDLSGAQDADMTDPEVVEIVDLLEDLIQESEQKPQ